jgi:hypothetical protein
MNINQICWHDGNLISLDWRGNPPCSLSLCCNLYASLEARNRETWQLDFHDISRLIILADIIEIQQNYFAGCIVDGIVLESDENIVVKILLTGGNIEVHCRSVTLNNKL